MFVQVFRGKGNIYRRRIVTAAFMHGSDWALRAQCMFYMCISSLSLRLKLQKKKKKEILPNCKCICIYRMWSGPQQWTVLSAMYAFLCSVLYSASANWSDQQREEKKHCIFKCEKARRTRENTLKMSNTCFFRSHIIRRLLFPSDPIVISIRMGEFNQNRDFPPRIREVRPWLLFPAPLHRKCVPKHGAPVIDRPFVMSLEASPLTVTVATLVGLPPSRHVEASTKGMKEKGKKIDWYRDHMH